MTDALATIQTDYPALLEGSGDTLAMIRDNLEGEAISPFDLDTINMSPEEGQEIYDAEVNRLAIKFGWPLPIEKGRRSQADYRVAKGLSLVWNYSPDEVAAVLLHGSDKASECGMDYVLRTVNAAV